MNTHVNVLTLRLGVENNLGDGSNQQFLNLGQCCPHGDIWICLEAYLPSHLDGGGVLAIGI